MGEIPDDVLAASPFAVGGETGRRDEIEITPAMIEAGVEILSGFNSDFDSYESFVAELYSAMERERIISRPVHVAAEAPKGASIVALGLMGTTGSVQHFGLSPETSANLRQQMEAAEQQALDNRKKNLQAGLSS